MTLPSKRTARPKLTQAARPSGRSYILFVHYSLKERHYSSGAKGLSIYTKEIVKSLRPELKYLSKILAKKQSPAGKKWEGFAYVFLDPGWLKLLELLRTGGLELATLVTQLAAARTEIERLLNFKERFGLIMADQLVGFLGMLDRTISNQAPGFSEEYRRLLQGDPRFGQLRYDSPKVIDSLIRIAHIGRNVPIFRFDDDVIFAGHRSDITSSDETRGNILKLCDAYQQLSEDPKVGYFVFSGGYLDTGASDNIRDYRGEEGKSKPPPEHLYDGFATRVLQLTELPRKASRWESRATLDIEKTALFLQHLHEVGADPFLQVVSGAGLCLSDGAVIDLPPYSNMHLHVMWIDDHLKYTLHHELGHFGINRRIRHRARLGEVFFKQSRYPGRPTLENVRWTLQTYMPRLIMGCVADSWLRAVPRQKLRQEVGSDEAYAELMTKVPGVYAARFSHTVASGASLDDRDKQELRTELWTLARERLGKISRLWSRSASKGTFLEVFITGSASHPPGAVGQSSFSEFLPLKMPEGFAKAVKQFPENPPQPKLPETFDVGKLSLDEAVSMLIEDFIEYLQWVIIWRHVVASVRLLLNQQGRQDLHWVVPPKLRA